MRSLLRCGLLVAMLPLLSSCATIQGLTALKSVDFDLDRVSNVQLAGIDFSNVRTIEDLGLLDTARITAAFAQRSLPLDMTIHVGAQNPADNSVTARLVQLDWSLFIEELETVSGVINDIVPISPGQRADIPVTVRLDLLQFFQHNARDLIELVMAVSGQGGAPKQIRLRATPTINTPLGPIRYPNPITIISKSVG